MEATAVSVGKAVLDAALGYAKSTAAEEMALQLGLERDVGFITDELEMMQSFLMTADEERDRNNDKVLTTWVKQVGNVAYDVEDNLVDFSIQAEREKPYFLGCVPRNLCDRRRIAMEVKELKAKVEDVSNRNKRYRLRTKDGAKPASLTADQGGIAGAAAAAMFGIDEAWSTAMDQEKAKVDLRVNNDPEGQTDADAPGRVAPSQGAVTTSAPRKGLRVRRGNVRVSGSEWV